MLQAFKDEYFWMLRESKGYVPWLTKYGHRFARRILGLGHRKHCCDDHYENSRDLMKTIMEGSIYGNELFDLLFKSIVRAEIRFSSRYVPQQSHEERLTGNLVSELDNAISLVKEPFREAAIRRYTEPKEIDFFYYDLSKGGKLEKETGADLAFIFVIDLPDFPFTARTVVLQAKKVNGTSAKIDREQYEAMAKHGDKAAYLFYDMNLRTLCPPFVYNHNEYQFDQNYKKSIENDQKSFSIDFDNIMSNGNPLSVFLLSILPFQESGLTHDSFEQAFNYIRGLCHWNKDEVPPLGPSARLAIVSVGKKIQFNSQNNESLSLTI